MSQFYARYVPPSKKSGGSTEVHEQSVKRKRTDREVEKSAKSPQQKRHKSSEDDSIAPSASNGTLEDQRTSFSGSQILDKYSISGFAQKNGEKEVTTRQVRKGRRTADKSIASAQREDGETNDKDEPAQTNAADRMQTKHTNVLSKFGQSRDRAAKQDASTLDTQSNSEPYELHGLDPLPQPPVVDQPIANPTFSTLPAWQSMPLRIEKPHSVSLSGLGINEQILKNLKKHKIQEAFPVQATVIPLLLERQIRQANDICVSAATGSGKTLSYVLPIIQALREKHTRTLRAVIVVPTRELVKQVRETCEICASGSDLRIVTAVGSKSLKDEQTSLIEEEEVYDPTEYRRQQTAPIDWTTFDLADEFRKARERRGGYRPNFVTRTRIKADVLVTTPGRLVDHLKNTHGFNLDHVQWLVVDEADCLLNESYQEWIEAVVPALQSRNATKDLDAALQAMRMDVPPRAVRKVLLSATMTQDISKLNALELYNPKLIVLGSTDRTKDLEHRDADDMVEPQRSAGETFHIPPSLQETAITFKEGGDKPLVLLKLLTERIRQTAKVGQNGGVAKMDIESSSSDNSTSDSDISSSSSSDSDSESDTDSETSSRSSVSLSSSPVNESTSSSGSGSDSDSSSDSDKQSAQRFRPRSKNQQQQQKQKQRHTELKQPQQPQPRTLIFTRSTSSASRLARLLTLFSPPLAESLALLTRSTTSSSSSRKALTSFRSGKTTILIATDRASRGIDVPGLEHVINYDIPGSALTYVHRVGRTARAGLPGHAWTLVEHREGRWFWHEIGGKGSAEETKISRSAGNTVRRMVIGVDDDVHDQRLRSTYEDALKTLGEEVKGE